MIRRVNFTGRVKIKQSSVILNVVNSGTSDVAFSCNAELEEYNFPGYAKVYLDVYRSSYLRRRFSLGSVESPVRLTNQKISEFSAFPVFNFKLYVIDVRDSYKLILGRTSPMFSLSGRSGEIPTPLLPVKYVHGMRQVWKLDYETGRAVLLLNSGITDISDHVTRDLFFRHSILPAVLREILFHLFIFEEVPDEEDNSDDYRGKWTKFIDNTLRMGDDLEIISGSSENEDYEVADRIEAIERIVEKFSEVTFNLGSAEYAGGR